MGIYIYTLRQTSPRQTPDGTVYNYKYSERYYWDSPAQRAREARHFERWEKAEGPTLVSVEGDNGTEVYRQERPVAVWSDCDEIHGEFVGYLVKKGRKWTIESLETTLLKDRQFLMAYITDHDLWDLVTCDGSTDSTAGQVQMYQRLAYDHMRAPFMKDNCFHTPATGTPERAVYERIDAAGYHAHRAMRALEQAA